MSPTLGKGASLKCSFHTENCHKRRACRESLPHEDPCLFGWCRVVVAVVLLPAVYCLVPRSHYDATVDASTGGAVQLPIPCTERFPCNCQSCLFRMLLMVLAAMRCLPCTARSPNNYHSCVIRMQLLLLVAAVLLHTM